MDGGPFISSRILFIILKIKKKKKPLIFYLDGKEIIQLYNASCYDAPTWAFGLVLIYLIGFEVFKFMDTNQIGVGIILSIYHEYLGKCLQALKNETNIRSSKFLELLMKYQL